LEPDAVDREVVRRRAARRFIAQMGEFTAGLTPSRQLESWGATAAAAAAATGLVIQPTPTPQWQRQEHRDNLREIMMDNARQRLARELLGEPQDAGDLDDDLYDNDDDDNNNADDDDDDDDNNNNERMIQAHYVAN
jgi:hypothetical protein